MGLFDAVEAFLSPVKMAIECPDSFYARQGSIEGHVKVTSDSPIQVDEVAIIMVERSWVSGEPEEEAVVGTASICSRPFSINRGEQATLEFSLRFSLSESGWDSVVNEGGVLGNLGKIVSVLDEGTDFLHRSYELVAAAELRGSKFDPKVTKAIYRSE